MENTFDNTTFLQQCFIASGGYRLAWPIETHLNVGDYGSINDHKFKPTGNINLNEYFSFTPVEGDGRGMGKEITIRKNGAVYFYLILRDLEYRGPKHIEDFEKKILDQYDEGSWDGTNVVIHEQILIKEMGIKTVDANAVTWLSQEPYWSNRIVWSNDVVDGNARTGKLKLNAFSSFYRCLKLKDWGDAHSHRDIGLEPKKSQGKALFPFDLNID